MRYDELKAYVGPATKCAHCGRPFHPGDGVTVADGGATVFCYTADGDCLMGYLYNIPVPRPLCDEPMVYRTPVAPRHEPAPVLKPRRWWQFWK